MAITRPAKKPPQGPRSDAEREALAGRASYVGSPEHKNQRWWGGLPEAGNRAPRQTTTICPLTSEQDRHAATVWIQMAIRQGQYKFVEGDKDFPKHVWYNDNGKGWLGFCVNATTGTYKGWPMTEDEYRAHFG